MEELADGSDILAGSDTLAGADVLAGVEDLDGELVRGRGGEASDAKSFDGDLFAGLDETTGGAAGSISKGDSSRVWTLRAWIWNTCWTNECTALRNKKQVTNRRRGSTAEVVDDEGGLNGDESSGAERVFHLPGCN